MTRHFPSADALPDATWRGAVGMSTLLQMDALLFRVGVEDEERQSAD
jgi:hypothetical protein